jgi:hypothetical protein
MGPECGEASASSPSSRSLRLTRRCHQCRPRVRFTGHPPADNSVCHRGLLDAALGAIAIAGVTQHVVPGYVRVVAVLVIVMLVSTALPPILRKLQTSATSGGRESSSSLAMAPPHASHVAELLAVADHLDGLVHDAEPSATQLEDQAARLRRIARRLETELPGDP